MQKTLLSWKPMSGYDIKKLVDAGLSHFWNENYGQIYPTLESLVKEGLAFGADILAEIDGVHRRLLGRFAEQCATFEYAQQITGDHLAQLDPQQRRMGLEGHLLAEALHGALDSRQAASGVHESQRLRPRGWRCHGTRATP